MPMQQEKETLFNQVIEAERVYFTFYVRKSYIVFITFVTLSSS